MQRGEKFMFKHNITRIIFCALAVFLLLVPSLYSKMKPVSEEDLDLVTAESGVTLDLNHYGQRNGQQYRDLPDLRAG